MHRVDSHGSHQVLSVAAQDLRNGVRSVAFSPDGTRLMTGDWAVTAVKVWDVRPTGAAEVGNFEYGGTAYQPASMTPDGRVVYLAKDPTHVARGEVPGERTVSQEPVPPSGGHVWNVAASPDGEHVAASTDRGEVFVWGAHDGRVQRRLGRDWHVDWVDDLAWNRSGSLLAVATTSGDRGTVHVVDTDGRVVSRFNEDPGVWISSLDFQGGPLLRPPAGTPGTIPRSSRRGCGTGGRGDWCGRSRRTRSSSRRTRPVRW